MWGRGAAAAVFGVSGAYAALSSRGTNANFAHSFFSSSKPAASSGAAAVPATFPANKVQGPKVWEHDFDVVVVGGGIVGLATAREIVNRFPNKTVAVIEKEAEVAGHQTGHNSGVIHAGMYYEPGSTMAKCCVEGARKMYEYCEAKSIPYLRCGKLICAATPEEYHWLELLLKNGNANGVEDLEILNSEQVKALEPNVEVYAALNSPNTGVVDYAVVARSFADDVVQSGRGDVKLSFEVEEFEPKDGVIVVKGKEPGQPGPHKQVTGKHVITCAGLYADRVSVAAGGDGNPKVLPFRGTYYQMKPEYSDIVSRNIYPVPSGGGIPVGVHFTPTVNERRGQQIIIGPGACLAFSRQGYKFLDMNLKDLWGIVSHIGLWKFAVANINLSLGEVYRDLNKAAFLKEAQKLIPSVTADMTEESFSGVMSQVFDNDGNAAKDYILERKTLDGKCLNVRSAPSPACTSSLAIAEHVVNIAAEDFNWE